MLYRTKFCLLFYCDCRIFNLTGVFFIFLFMVTGRGKKFICSTALKWPMSNKSLVIFLLVCFHLFICLFFCSFRYISLFQFFTKITELINRERDPWFKISQRISVILLKWFAEHCQTIWRQKFRRQKYDLFYSKFMQVLDQRLREWRCT